MSGGVDRGDPVLLTLLREAQEGKRVDKLIPYLYKERRLDQAMFSRTPPGQAIRATVLVHEAHLGIRPPPE